MAAQAEGAMLERAMKELEATRVRQLAARRIYHQNKIDEIDKELKMLLKDDVGSIDY
ncbi:MAG: hypothetical protein Q7S43_00260 [bacterium]|nr:hypothetical protein [bacterium]